MEMETKSKHNSKATNKLPKVTQLEWTTDEEDVDQETTHYHLLGRVSRASAKSTGYFFILGLKWEIVNLQEVGITLHIRIWAIEFVIMLTPSTKPTFEGPADGALLPPPNLWLSS